MVLCLMLYFELPANCVAFIRTVLLSVRISKTKQNTKYLYINMQINNQICIKAMLAYIHTCMHSNTHVNMHTKQIWIHIFHSRVVEENKFGP